MMGTSRKKNELVTKDMYGRDMPPLAYLALKQCSVADNMTARVGEDVAQFIGMLRSRLDALEDAGCGPAAGDCLQELLLATAERVPQLVALLSRIYDRRGICDMIDEVKNRKQGVDNGKNTGKESNR